MRFGFGVTTNNLSIGFFCPAISENGVVAAQYGTYGEIGLEILPSRDTRIPATDAVPAALDASNRASTLQVHALGQESRTVHYDEALPSYHEEDDLVFGDVCNENCSVAGNSLVNRNTLRTVAATFDEGSKDRNLPTRLSKYSLPATL